MPAKYADKLTFGVDIHSDYKRQSCLLFSPVSIDNYIFYLCSLSMTMS